MKLKSRHSSAPGNGFARGEVTGTGGMPGASPSGAIPICCGVRMKNFRANTDTVMTVARPTTAAAAGNPINAIANTHSGEKIRPAKLAPLYAVPSATGRVRTNHGDTTAFTTTPPIAAQPAPLTKVAAKSCHGSRAIAQPQMPIASKAAAVTVTEGRPKRRDSAGPFGATKAAAG